MAVSMRCVGTPDTKPVISDPGVAAILYTSGQKPLGQANGTPPDGALAGVLVNLGSNCLHMVAGGSTTWWQNPSEYAPTNIEYICDQRLGTPSVVDCTNAEFQITNRIDFQVKPSSPRSLSTGR